MLTFGCFTPSPNVKRGHGAQPFLVSLTYVPAPQGPENDVVTLSFLSLLVGPFHGGRYMVPSSTPITFSAPPFHPSPHVSHPMTMWRPELRQKVTVSPPFPDARIVPRGFFISHRRSFAYEPPALTALTRTHSRCANTTWLPNTKKKIKVPSGTVAHIAYTLVGGY